jgi:hypothetical protein
MENSNTGVDYIVQSVEDIHDYIHQYLYAKQANKSTPIRGSMITVRDDLYDDSSNIIRDFAMVISSKVTDLFDAQSRRQRRINSPVRMGIAMIIVLFIIMVIAPTAYIISVAVRAYLKKIDLREFLPEHGFVIGITFTVLYSICSIAITKFKNDVKILGRVRLIDLQTQVPYTQLLWDQSVRLLYYNTMSEDDRTNRIANDAMLANDCNTNDDGHRGADMRVADRAGDDVCGRPVMKLTPQYLEEFRRWVVNFYDHKDIILYKLRSLDSEDAISRLKASSTVLAGTVKADKAGRTRASLTDVNKIVTSVILPILQNSYYTYKDSIVQGVEYHKAQQSKDECVDKCVTDPDCSMAVSDGGTCRLYRDGSETYITAAKGSAVYVSTAGKSRAAYVLGSAVPSKTAMKDGSFTTLQSCMASCGRKDDCAGCWQPTDKSVEAFSSSNAEDIRTAAAVPAPAPCDGDCHFMKRTGADLSATAVQQLSELRSRSAHLSKKVGSICMMNGFAPRDAYDAVMRGLQAHLPAPSFQLMKDDYTKILKAADAQHAQLNSTKLYVDNWSFASRLSKMTNAEFIASFVQPTHEVHVASKVLKNKLMTVSDVYQDTSSMGLKLYDAVIANTVVISTLYIVHVMYARSKETSINTAFTLQMLLLVCGVAFMIALLWSSKNRHAKDSEARDRAVKNSGSRLFVEATSLNNLINMGTRAEWIKRAMGVKKMVIDDITGVITVDGAPYDPTSPFGRRTLDLDTLGDNRYILASDIRTRIILLDKTVNDCNDFLKLRQPTVFPWGQVLILLLGIVLVAGVFIYTTGYVRPGEILDRLNMCIQKLSWDEMEYKIDADESRDHIMQIIMMVLSILILLIMTIVTVNSANMYNAADTMACRNKFVFS